MYKVYISGQISGLHYQEASDLFGRAEALMLTHEKRPVNPLKVEACPHEDCNGTGVEAKYLPSGSYHHSWQCYMRTDLIAMLECDTIAMLPNFTNSRGAQLELEVAQNVDLNIVYFDPDIRSWS